MEGIRSALKREVDVVKLIRSLRFMHMALKHILDPSLRKELKLQSKLKKIQIDEE